MRLGVKVALGVAAVVVGGYAVTRKRCTSTAESTYYEGEEVIEVAETCRSLLEKMRGRGAPRAAAPAGSVRHWLGGLVEDLAAVVGQGPITRPSQVEPAEGVHTVYGEDPPPVNTRSASS